MRRDGLSKTKVILIIAVAVLLIALFGLALYMIENHGLIDTQFGDTGGWGDEDPYEQYITIGDKDYVTQDNLDTYLLIGTDAGGEDLGEMYSGELADFLLLLLVDNTTEKYAFYQIDRNTMTDVPVLDENGEPTSFETMQVCISHWYGKTMEDRNDNTMLAVSTIMGNMDIDSCYTLSMKNIGDVNNALGGVEVEIQEDLTDLDPAFTAGSRVLLTDEQAELFVRSRMNVGDGTNKGRMSRQTQYLQSAYSLIMNQVRENPEYINDLYSSLSSKIDAGGDTSNMSKVTNQLVNYENCGIRTFEGTVKTNDTIGEGIEHEEFYMDENSLLENLSAVIDMREDS